MNSRAVCLLSFFALLLCFSSVLGGCLNDGDTAHSPADYKQRLWSYTSSAPVAPSTSSSLKFYTYNLQSGYSYGCVNSPSAQAQIMRGSDYMANEEVVQYVDTRCSNCVMPKVLADTAGVSSRFAMAMPYRSGQYGVSVATSQNILETKYVMLNYSNVEQRVSVGVRTQPPALGGRTLWFFTVHIEYYVPAARVSQATQLLDFFKNEITDPNAVIVMAGDYNGGPDDTCYGMFKNAGFIDAWEKFNGSPDKGWTIPADWPGSRFDHIWYKVPTGLTVSVTHAEVPNVLLSDHRPFTATLSFGSGSGGAPPVGATTRPTPAPTPAPTAGSPISVGPIWENNPITLTCPGTKTMTSTLFASYGTPIVSALGDFSLGTCMGGSSVAVINDKCIGRKSCTFGVSNNVFGDPCPHVGKYLVVKVMCS